MLTAEVNPDCCHPSVTNGVIALMGAAQAATGVVATRGNESIFRVLSNKKAYPKLGELFYARDSTNMLVSTPVHSWIELWNLNQWGHQMMMRSSSFESETS